MISFLRRIPRALAVALTVTALASGPGFAEEASPPAEVQGEPQEQTVADCSRSSSGEAFLRSLEAESRGEKLEAPAEPELQGRPLCSCAAFTVDCGGGLELDCCGFFSCTSQQRNCALGQPGFVNCDGAQQNCPPC